MLALVGESGLRQDDAGAHDHGARAADRRRGVVPRRAARVRRRARCKALPARRADGLPGPAGRAQPAADDLRGGRRGPAHPRARRGGEEATVAEALSVRACGRPSGSSPSTRTRSPGGQRQRVVIAGAMVLDPWLIVADEPVSSLDASVRGEILALMLKLVRETGRHDPRRHPRPRARLEHRRPRRRDVPRAASSRRATTEELLDDPRHPYTRRCSRSCPRSSSWSSRSSRARRPTRRASRPAAGSTRAARSSRRARPSGSGSRSAAAARIRRSPVAGQRAGRHLAACHAVPARRRRRIGRARYRAGRSRRAGRAPSSRRARQASPLRQAAGDRALEATLATSRTARRAPPRRRRPRRGTPRRPSAGRGAPRRRRPPPASGCGTAGRARPGAAGIDGRDADLAGVALPDRAIRGRRRSRRRGR